MFLSAFPLDLFGFERYTSLAGGGWSYHSFSTRLRVLKLEYFSPFSEKSHIGVQLQPSSFFDTLKGVQL
jgi:hypothetical protein